MAEVGSVDDLTPLPPPRRHPARDRRPSPRRQTDAKPAPTTHTTWVVASVVDDAACVVGRIFDDADRRDPDHQRVWVALVDGNNHHQVSRVHAEVEARGADATIICDFIHVLEYLWKAAWCFYDQADPAAEHWVHDHASAVLAGKASRSRPASGASHMSRSGHPLRANADTAATYLVNKAAYLDYPTALTRGWPIATGVIEGACRHLVNDRLDLTGARWGQQIVGLATGADQRADLTLWGGRRALRRHLLVPVRPRDLLRRRRREARRRRQRLAAGPGR